MKSSCDGAMDPGFRGGGVWMIREGILITEERPFETPPAAAPQDKGARLEARAASLQPNRHEAFAGMTD